MTAKPAYQIVSEQMDKLRLEIKADIKGLDNSINERFDCIEEKYLLKTEFEARFSPYQRVFNIIMGVVITGIVTAILANIIRASF